MRKLLLALVPAISIAAAPAFAQSSVSSETTTTSSGTVEAPVTGETTTKKVYKRESNMPGTEGSSETRSEKKVTTNGLGDTSEVSKSEHRTEANGINGSHSESNSTTTRTGPN
jgi:hypothetical protein